MEYRYDIPESFWSLFRSRNRDTYIGALLRINEEYEYNSYFLSREICIQVLQDFLAEQHSVVWQEEDETESEALETPAARVLNWLLKKQWLKKLEDYYNQVTNIIIPDYAAIFVDAFERLTTESEDTEVYIQNIYAILFSFLNDPRANESLLKTALVNTRKLNKSLQDMLHNMDKFFGSLLEKKNYGDLLKEHLEGYVEEIIKKKYHILKTSDNFYLYKNDIKTWIDHLQRDTGWIGEIERREHRKVDEAEILKMLDGIDRGFHDIEHRLNNMDKEHMKYVRATVTRLNYLLNQEGDSKGLMIQILNEIARSSDREEKIRQVAGKLNFSAFDILSDKSLYKRRRSRKRFAEELKADEERQPELSTEEVLRLNRIHNRYSRKEIEEFLDGRLRNGRVEMEKTPVTNEEEFEKLILAYDYAMKKDSKYQVLDTVEREIQTGRYQYPALIFVRRRGGTT